MRLRCAVCRYRHVTRAAGWFRGEPLCAGCLAWVADQLGLRINPMRWVAH